MQCIPMIVTNICEILKTMYHNRRFLLLFGQRYSFEILYTKLFLLWNNFHLLIATFSSKRYTLKLQIE